MRSASWCGIFCPSSLPFPPPLWDLLLLLSALPQHRDPPQVLTRAGSAALPRESRGRWGGRAIWAPPASPSWCGSVQERGAAGKDEAFELRSEVGKESSLQFPCQLGWLISTRTGSNKNRHLHNTGGSPWKHSAGVSETLPGLRSGNAPCPWKGSSSLCQGAMRKGPCPFWGDGSPSGEGLGGFAPRITQWRGSAPTCLGPHHKQRLL